MVVQNSSIGRVPCRTSCTPSPKRRLGQYQFLVATLNQSIGLTPYPMLLLERPDKRGSRIDLFKTA